MRSRGSALLLILALVAPGLEPLAASVAHGCTTHVCHCRAPHPGAATPKESPKPCHEAAAAREPVPMRDCTLRGACRHEAPQVAAAPPYILVAVMDSIALSDTGQPRADVSAGSLVGFDRLDPRPPRTTA
jgi:hypothetical protein